MAKWIAAHDPEITSRDVSEALEGSNPERIEFKSETQIHITYMTVTVDEDGSRIFGVTSITKKTASRWSTNMPHSTSPPRMRNWLKRHPTNARDKAYWLAQRIRASQAISDGLKLRTG